MKIILSHKDILPDGRGGGIGTLYFNLAQQLSGMGHEVTVIGGITKSMGTSSSFQYIYVPFIDYDRFRTDIRNIVIERNPDIYECSVWRAEGLSYAEHRKRKEHGSLLVIRGDLCSAQFSDTKYANDEKRMMILSDMNLSVSKSCEKILRNVYGCSIEKVIYNGVDTDYFRMSENNNVTTSRKKQIIWVGRANYMKGFDILRTIIDKSPPIFTYHVVIGESRKELPIIFKNKNVRIYYKISLRKLIHLYQRMQICLSTSRFEGFGLSVLEAMACGVPAVVPKESGGLTEIIRNGHDGFLYSLSEPTEVFQFFDAIKSIHAANSLKRAQRFSWQQTGVQTIKAYEKILTKSRSVPLGFFHGET